MSAIETDDVPTNTSANPHFNDIVDKARSRRWFMKSGLGLGAVGFLGAGVAGCGDDDSGSAVSANPAPTDGSGTTPPKVASPSLLGFDAVEANSLDTITVPKGYKSAVFCRWGDPLFPNSPAWKGDASEDAEAQRLQFGDNHDGMHFFPLRSGDSSEGLLVMNHEYFNADFFFTPEVQSGEVPWSADHVLKGQHAHGVSVAHVKLEGGDWKVVLDSPFNRRIHLNTPMLITGPAKGHALMRTGADAEGTMSLGTVNNCGNGYTLWNTYLTCEENFNGYFGTTSGADSRTASMKRYGITALESSYRWEEHDPRFDYVKEPNESNRMGWIVEIDPFDPVAPPRKRTALGRFKHENAAQTLARDNRVVVYMGDDQANDYLYKFVSTGKYDEELPGLNRNLLDAGTLYVARFGAGPAAGDMAGTGDWVPLRLDTPAAAGGTLGSLFADMGALLIDTRLAADAVGATKMDRPEWVTVHPSTGEGYCTLTNNSSRKDVDEANPRASNVYGQIVRWREAGGDAAALAFEWDLFVLAGNPAAHPPGDLQAGSANVTIENTFNSPDGLAFDGDGRLWIQTDGNFSNAGPYAGQGNNQMLVADPVSGEIRRFLVGPSGCEITGITWTPDQRHVFVNVQHPGEYGSHPNKPAVEPAEDPLAFSKWPEASGGRPRSSTVVVWKEDGGKVGT
jgi:secreted PhoX family phosphatase